MAPASGGTSQLHDGVVAGVLALPHVRPDALVRARALLDSRRWCRADEVADVLVTCLVERRLP